MEKGEDKQRQRVRNRMQFAKKIEPRSRHLEVKVENVLLLVVEIVAVLVQSLRWEKWKDRIVYSRDRRGFQRFSLSVPYRTILAPRPAIAVP